MDTESDENSASASTVDGDKEYVRTPQARRTRVRKARRLSTARQSRASKSAPASATSKPSAQSQGTSTDRDKTSSTTRQSRRCDPRYKTVPDLCVLCQTEKTRPKDRRRVEPLTRCTNLGSTLLDAARLQQKERVLIYLEGLGVDNVAAEVVYHRSCYQEFTNKRVLDRLKDTSAEKESPYTAAFKALFAQVEQALLEDEQVMALPAVRDRFVECLREEGVENPAYRTEKVKRHLREHFDKRVFFYQPDKVGEPGIVYGSIIPLHRLARFLND